MPKLQQLLLILPTRIYLLASIFVFVSGCSGLAAFDGIGKQNPPVDQCANSPFALAIAQGDIATVRQLIPSINLNKPYMGRFFLSSFSDSKVFPQIGFYGCKRQVTYLDIALNARNLDAAKLLLEHGANPNLQFHSETKYSLDHPDRADIYSPRNSEGKSRHSSTICPSVADHIFNVHSFPDVANPGSAFNLSAIRLLAHYKGLETDCGRQSIVEAYIKKNLLPEAKLLVELGANVTPAPHAYTWVRAINAGDSNGYTEPFTEEVVTSPLHFAISRIPDDQRCLDMANLIIEHGANINDVRFLPVALANIANHPKGNSHQLMEVFKLAIKHDGNGEYLKRELIRVSLSSRLLCKECFELLAASGVNFSDAFDVFFFHACKFTFQFQEHT